MAAPRQPGRVPEADLAERVEAAAEQRRLVQRRLRGRNGLMALGIGAVALGIYGFTFYKISQERFLDELEEEVKAAQTQAANTPAN